MKNDNPETMKRTERAALAVQRHRAGEPVATIARDLGISAAAVYRAIKRRQDWAAADQAHADKIRNEASEAHRVDLARRRAQIEALPRGRGPDGSSWVSLADVLQLLL